MLVVSYMAADIGVAQTVLPIKNPNRFFGGIQLTLGLLMLVYLVWWLYSRLILPTITTVDALNRLGFMALSPLPGISLASSWAAFLFGLSVCGRSALVGLRCFLDFGVPAGTPENLPPAEVIDNLLDNRQIVAFHDASTVISKLASELISKFRFLTKPTRSLAEEADRSIRRSLAWMIALIIPAVFSGLIANTLGVRFSYPFPWLPVIVIGLGMLVRIIATLLLKPVNPEVNVYRQDLHIAQAGNPKNLFNHVMSTLEQLKSGSFSHRVFRNLHPNMVDIRPGVTSTMAGDVVIETQPLPFQRDSGLAPHVLCLGGALLRLAGTIMLLELCASGIGLRHPHNQDYISWSISLALLALSARVALRDGRYFLAKSLEFFNLIHFSSFVYRIGLDGTYTASHIGLKAGASVGGLESQRVAIQSDCYIHLYGCQIISEARGLKGVMGMTGERMIISAPASNALQGILATLAAGIAGFRDTSGGLPRVELNSTLGEMIQVNQQLMAPTGSPGSGVPLLVGAVDAPSRQPSPPPLLGDDSWQASIKDSTPPGQLRCAHCGCLSEAGKRFCADCGEPISA